MIDNILIIIVTVLFMTTQKTIRLTIVIIILFLIIGALYPIRSVYAQCLGGICKTAIGDMRVDPAGFTQDIFDKSMLVAGGISFLLMLSGAFKFLTSAGDPQKLQEATDIIMSAIAGLLLIVFSVFILRLLGRDILGIFPP